MSEIVHFRNLSRVATFFARTIPYLNGFSPPLLLPPSIPAHVLNAIDVLGPCEIDFKVNKITIQRHLRGFYHQLTFQNGRFEDTGDL
jgi:hypothetical protein